MEKQRNGTAPGSPPSSPLFPGTLPSTLPSTFGDLGFLSPVAGRRDSYPKFLGFLDYLWVRQHPAEFLPNFPQDFPAKDQSRSPKAGHNKAGRSDFRNHDSNPIRGKCGKCGRSLSPQKNKGLRRCRRAKTRKTRTPKRGKRGKCG